MVYTLRFFSLKCSLFHNSNLFGSCIIHILYTKWAKIKKNNSGAKRLTGMFCRTDKKFTRFSSPISLFIFIFVFELMLVRNMIRFGIHRLCLSRDILKYGVGISVDTISPTNPQQYILSHVFESLCLLQTSLPIPALPCSWTLPPR